MNASSSTRALSVGAVQHRHLAPVQSVVTLQLLGGSGHPHCLVALVLCVVADDPLAVARVGPQVLRLAFEVVVDHRICGVENRLVELVVLVEHDRGDIWKRILELQDVAEIRPAGNLYTLL